MADMLEREPRDLAEAIHMAEGYHRGTVKTLFSHQNGVGMIGGYGGLYMLLEQKGYFASLLTPELCAEGLGIVAETDVMEIEYEMISSHRYGISGEGRMADRLHMLPSEHDQDAACLDKMDTEMRDPRSLERLQRQSTYEDRLIAYLKSQIKGS